MDQDAEKLARMYGPLAPMPAAPVNPQGAIADWLTSYVDGSRMRGADSGRYGYTSDKYDFDEPMARKAYESRNRNRLGAGVAGTGAALGTAGAGMLAYEMPLAAPFTVPTAMGGVGTMAGASYDAYKRQQLMDQILQGYRKDNVARGFTSGTGGAE